jgi:drug/metabolite transporter (DMT)-like permease
LPSLSCALTYSILVIAFVLATKMTTAANAILLLYTAPVYVALLAPFFIKEPTRGRDWLFIIAAIGGIVLFFMDSLSLEGMRGNLLALGFLQQGLGYFLFSLAAPHLSALELIVIPSIEPILNPVLAALFIGEIPGAWSLAGGIIVLVTITSWSIIRAGGKKEQGAARRGRSGAAIKVRPAAKRTS